MTAPTTLKDDITILLRDLGSLKESLGEDDGAARKAMLAKARSLTHALETPLDAILRMLWAEPALFTAMKVAIDLQLFSKMAENGEEPKSTVDLAIATKSDPVLLTRLLKHMAATEVVRETSANHFILTPLSKALIEPKYSDPFPLFFDLIEPSYKAIPTLLSETSYANPQDPRNGVFQIANRTPLTWFEYLNSHPARLSQFGSLMRLYGNERQKWYDPSSDFFPVIRELVESETCEDEVLLIDIAGNMGHEITAFSERFPDVKGRLMLQDLAPVVEEARQFLPAKIETQAYDFFTPQPVLGARAYFIKNTFHNWSDADVLRALKNQASAMRPGYSKLLLHENVIPAQNAHWMSTGLDIVMMACFSTQERKEETWRDLVNQAGLEVSRIWQGQPGEESLIECGLACGHGS